MSVSQACRSRVGATVLVRGRRVSAGAWAVVGVVERPACRRGVVWTSATRRAGSGGVGEHVELPERGGEFACPWPACLQSEDCAAPGEGEPAGDVQQPVAQPFGLGL